MAVLSVVRSRLLPALRWLAPSAFAACAGTVVAGSVEGALAPTPLVAVATAGFFAMVAIPLLLILAITFRALYAAWRPAELATRWTEEGGSMPRLAAWLMTVWIGALVLAWTTFQGTWLLAAWTAFKPLAVGFAQPVIAVVSVVCVIVLSRPIALAGAAVARRLDRRWRRPGRRTLLSPRRIVIAGILGAALTVYALARFVVRSRLGTFDTTLVSTPILGALVTWLAHLAWSRLGRARTPVALAVAGVALVAISTAASVASRRPATAIAIWGARPIAGVAVEWFDLDRIRDDVPLAELRPRSRPDAAHPDIVLVTIDALRADLTPPYGGTARMPVLAELGERGAVFTWAFAPSNMTRRSIPSIVTGTAPNRIRGHLDASAARLDPRHVVLAERMRAGGYSTAAFSCCGGWPRGLEHVTIDADSARLAGAARAWLEQRRSQPSGAKPLFVWVHLLETQPEATDRALAELLGGFAQRAPIVIVTANSGGMISKDLHNAQIRVPFVITGPGIRQNRIAETVSLTDLTPTVLDLAGFVVPGGASMDGRSLADLATGHREPGPAGTAFAVMIEDGASTRGQTALIQGRWKLIEDGDMYELYDLHADPEEQSNQVTVRPDLVLQLRRFLDARKAAARSSPFERAAD